MALTYHDVADIIKIIDASNCDEVIIELGDTKIVVRRGAGGAGSGHEMVVPKQQQNPVTALAVSETPKAEKTDSLLSKAAASLIRAPMTGTFYRAPSPKDSPFVEVGTSVKKGDTLCMVEVMKLYTSIQAEFDGVIAQIFPTDASVVQVDQPLFRIEVL